MAKISTYPSADTPLLLSDRLIGTEAPRVPPLPTPLATKNFSLSELLNLFSVNFPAASLQEVLDMGNTATQNIYLTGQIDVDVIKPVNIEDTTGSQGTTFQYLSKGTSSISWVTLPVDNLQAVLNSGNSATQNIKLVGNITSTLVTPENIKDELSNLGSSGQILTKTATGIKWANSSVPTAPSLADVLSTGNSATNDINLTGNVYATTFVKSGGLSSQFLKADGSVDSSVYALASSLPTATSDLTNDGADGINPFITLADVPSQVNSDWNSTSGVSEILNKPTIPAAQVNSDWNATSGVAEILNKPTLTNGTVTSVGLTMPSAFSVANSPITTSGDIAVTGAGTVAQYVRGDGSLANFPSSTGGGSSLAFYLNGSVAQGTFGGVAFKEMDRTPVFGAGTDFTINANGYIQSFITDANVPNLLEIPAGNWNFETYFSASSGGGSPSFYVELYKWDGATLSLIASNSATPEGITNGTAIDAYFSALAVPQTTLAATDRLAIRIYVTHSGRTIKLHTENSHLCQVITTFSTGLTALNGLTAQVQNFATGTSGTDFAISSATSTHTFNLPTASAANRGALSSADWTTFNGKFTLPALTSGSVLFSNGTTIVQDNANLFWDDTNNRLGIGTASPAYGVDIAGAVGAASSIRTGWGVYSRYLINPTATATYIEFQPSTHQINFGINGTEAMRLTTTRNLLIGTTTDAGYKLDVNGTARFVGQVRIGGEIVAENASTLTLSSFNTADAIKLLSQQTFVGSVGDRFFTTVQANFSPTSGTSTFALLRLSTIINQTGGANGITRGLYINPTLTAVADFRAIEVASGTTVLAPSVTARASLRIPSGTAPTSPVNGDIWFDGTDIKMRIGGVTKTFTLL